MISSASDMFALPISCVAGAKKLLASAKAWIRRVKESGIETGDASIGRLKALLDEADAIGVDLTAHVSTLQQATRVYCLCRGPHFAEKAFR